MKPNTSSAIDAVSEFWAAPDEALFRQGVVADVLDLSEEWCERARWAGNGPPFLKISRAVRYRKADVVEWLERRRINSTSASARDAA